MTVVEPLTTGTITPPPRGAKKADPYENAPTEKLFEVVNGSVVEKSMSAFEQFLGGLIHGYLVRHCFANDVGRPLVETMLAIPSRGNDRKPDVAFVSYARWPKNRPVPRVNAWPVVPELVVEVVSPTDTFTNVLDKVHEYLEAGARTAWVVLPNVEQVYVYTEKTAIAILGRDGVLTTDLLPGFELPIRILFPDAEPAT